MNQPLDFSKLPLKDAMVLRQTLSAAMASAKSLPVMFCLHANDGSPTPAQAALAEEILSEVLNGWTVSDEDSELIEGCLIFMLDNFKVLAADDLVAEGMNGKEYVQRMYGIDFTKEFEDILAKYCRSFNHRTIIHTYNLTLDYAKFDELIDKMEAFANKSITEMHELIDKKGYEAALDNFDVQVDFNGRAFILPCTAATYNGLIDYIKYIKSEQ